MIRHSSTSNEIPNWLCLLIGLIFTITPVFMIKSEIDIKNSMDSQTQSFMVTHEKERRRKTKGTGYETYYRHIYHYSVDGETYSCRADASSSFKSNKNKTIYYKSNKPKNCFVDEGFSGMFFKVLFFLSGLISFFLYFQNNTSSKN